MASLVELTYYEYTGYNMSDEPASDAVINQNAHWTATVELKEYDPGNLQQLKTNLNDDEVRRVDYIKVTSDSGERWYYFVVGHQRINNAVVLLRIVLDAFATVGLSNISFFGNVSRRSLSPQEATDYPLLPEPWAPRRPLKTRRLIIDLNINKTPRIPSHISNAFEEETTHIEHEPPVKINVPNSAAFTLDIGTGHINPVSTFEDGLSFSVDIPMGYPNPAAETTHTINSPWGSLTYTTPYEQYFNLGGAALTTFLAKAKKYNALDLIEMPFYLPNPGQNQTVTIPEVSNPATKNIKASKYYTTITIRSLASNSNRTYSDNDTILQYNQPLTVVIAPDKHGGIYVLPRTMRDTGLNEYTYLEGVYSPFETITYNAIGDTPAKFAADGTMLHNTELNNLYREYTNKVNAIQYEQMISKYYKDLGPVKGAIMAYGSELLGAVSKTVTTTEAYEQVTNIVTDIAESIQRSIQTQDVPRVESYQNSYNYQAYDENGNPQPPPPPYTERSVTTNYNTATRSDTPGYYTEGTTWNNAYGEQNTDTYIPFQRTDTYPAYGNPYSETLTDVHHKMTGMSRSVTPEHEIHSSGTVITDASQQKSVQTADIPSQVQTSVTTQEGAERSIEQGNQTAIDNVDVVYEIDGPNAWNTLKAVVLGGYRSEVHSFMLGNINDYLNRWVSIQNDIHNGKVANLFKNITLVGTYSDTNKLAGKYEILIASLQPEDEANFDLFLTHFGHAVDEYTNTLVFDAKDNYNYTMVGEDALLSNSVRPDANTPILNQFRTGVRVWKTLIRPENY